MNRPEIRARFRAVVARALERADREHREHLAGLRPATLRRRPRKPYVIPKGDRP